MRTYLLTLSLLAAFGAQAQTCFQRDYDDAHLLRNPGQTIRQIALLMENVASVSAVQSRNGHAFTLAVRDRDADGAFTYRAEGRCLAAGRGKWNCRLDEEQGYFSLKTQGTARLLTVQAFGLTLSGVDPESPEGEEHQYELEAGATNGVFRLTPSALKDCQQLITQTYGGSAG